MSDTGTVDGGGLPRAALESEIEELRAQNEILNKQSEKLGQIIAGFLYSAGALEEQPVYLPGEVMKAVLSRGKTSLQIGTNPEDQESVIIKAKWENRVVMPSMIVAR